MDIHIPKAQVHTAVALFRALSSVFPDHYQEMIDLARNARNGITLSVSPTKMTRTRNQENYYRKWCGEFAKFCGMTPDEMHEEMLCQCYGSEEVETRMGVVRRPVKRSEDCSRTDYSELVDTLIRVAAEMGFDVPPSVNDRLA